MATTTNYSWTTPDDTDLVKDGASAIRTLGSSADTTVKNLNPGTTAGDIDYYTSSTAKARIAIGTAGQVLAVNAGATAPEWIAAPGGGKVLQVIHGTTSTPVTSSTDTFVDSNLTATITPSSASNKVLVFVTQAGVAVSTGDRGVALRLLRDATVLQSNTYALEVASGGVRTGTEFSIAYLDTPATTSALTYKTQVASQTNAASINAQRNNGNSNIVLMEVAP
jgi:hypothetical protein